ncbi:MAG: PAS domain S-box protein [Cyanobacteria bacterium P01_C01_bin.72]
MMRDNHEQLAKSLAWLQLVVDELPQTIFWKGLDSRYLGCDRSFAKLGGVASPQEVVGKCDYDLPWTGAESNWYRECDHRVMASDTPEYGILETQVNAEGKLTWIETNKIPLHDSEGNVIGVLGTHEDVTSRQLAEEKIKQSLRKLSDFQLALTRSAIVSIMDSEGIITYVNDRFCEISQYSAAELVGKTHRVVDSQYHSAEFWQHLWTTISKGEIWQGEIYDRAKDGRGYWVNATIIPSLDQQNRPVQYLEILEDISERKQTESALAYQLQKTKLFNQLTQAIHQSLDTQTIFQTATTQIRLLLEVDCVGIFQLEQDCSVQDLSPGNISKLVAWDIIDSQASLPISDRLQECCFDTYLAVNYQQGDVLAIADTETADLTEAHQHLLASLNIKAYLVVPILQGNHLWGLLCLYQFSQPRQWSSAEIEFMQKIATHLCLALSQAQLLAQEKHQRHLLDCQNQQLRQAKEEAEQANIAKSSFLAHMSHELRTPLNVILGFSQVMYHDVTVTPSQRETLKIINQSGEHLLHLINDVLEVTKIEAGKTDLKTVSFDLHYLLESIEKMLSLKAHNRGLKLRFARSPDVPAYIHSDQGKVRQILINLLNNALKFTSQGEVELNTKVITSSHDHFELCFTVTDTGIGIKPSELESLFDPFVQTESGIKSQQGTGLGLSIGRKFARLMGGDITVTSCYGSGSQFSFNLPVTAVAVVENDEKSSRRAIALEPGQPEYRLLVVDDKEENRLLLNHLLSALGFVIREASNGRECLDIYSVWQPQLILMDIHMPLMNGIEATLAIKKRSPKLPIIALTASAFDSSKSEVLQAGCDDFLSKPIKDTLLFEKIAQYLPVTYTYAAQEASAPTETSQLAAEDLSFMPPQWLTRVNQAASQLNEQLLQELIAEIPESHISIRTALAQKVTNFDFDEILELISQP